MRDSGYPTMPVLKTTSPVIVFSAPNPLPRRMVPSSRIRAASFSELGTFGLEMEGSQIRNLRLCPDKGLCQVNKPFSTYDG